MRGPGFLRGRCLTNAPNQCRAHRLGRTAYAARDPSDAVAALVEQADAGLSACSHPRPLRTPLLGLQPCLSLALITLPQTLQGPLVTPEGPRQLRPLRPPVHLGLSDEYILRRTIIVAVPEHRNTRDDDDRLVGVPPQLAPQVDHRARVVVMSSNGRGCCAMACMAHRATIAPEFQHNPTENIPVSHPGPLPQGPCHSAIW